MIWAWLAYIMWGLFPAFFPLLKPATPLEILGHRFIWTLVFMIIVLAITRQLKGLRGISASLWGVILLAGILISVNWGVYILAVNSGHVADAALGYFINPLVNVLLGVAFLKERLRRLQWASVAVAVIAVIILTIDVGHPPYIALSLALSFGLYGLVKKRVPLDPKVSLTAEALVLTPVALVYLGFLTVQGTSTFVSEGASHTVLLMVAGVVTAVPLLCFGFAAQRITLTALGMLQYITPSAQMLWAVFVTHEHLSAGRWIGFGIIWVSVALFIADIVLASRSNFSHRRTAHTAND